MNIHCWCVAILDFCLPLASHIMKNSFVEFLDLENMGIAVGIEQLYCIPNEIIIIVIIIHSWSMKTY